MSTNGFTPALWNRIKSYWSCPSVVEKPAKLPISQTTFDSEEQNSQSRCLKNAELIDQISEAKRCLQDFISERLSKDQQMINMRKSYAMFCHEYENLLETYEQGFAEQSEAICQLSEAVQQESDHHKERIKQLRLENQQLKKRLSASNEALAETYDLTEQLFEQIADSVNGLLNSCLTHSRDTLKRQRATQRQSRAVLAKFRAWKSKKAVESQRQSVRLQPQKPSQKLTGFGTCGDAGGQIPLPSVDERRALQQAGRQVPGCESSTTVFRHPNTCTPCSVLGLFSIRRKRQSLQRTADRYRSAFDSSDLNRCAAAARRKKRKQEEEEEVRPDESVSQIHCRSRTSFKDFYQPVSACSRSTFVAKKNWMSESSESGISLDRLNELLEL